MMLNHVRRVLWRSGATGNNRKRTCPSSPRQKDSAAGGDQFAPGRGGARAKFRSRWSENGGAGLWRRRPRRQQAYLPLPVLCANI